MNNEDATPVVGSATAAPPTSGDGGVPVLDVVIGVLAVAGVGLLLGSTGRLMLALLGLLFMVALSALSTFTAVVGTAPVSGARRAIAITMSVAAVVLVLVMSGDRFGLLVPLAALVAGVGRSQSNSLRVAAAIAVLSAVLLIP